jgi:acyl-CoA thioester hydrolase
MTEIRVYYEDTDAGGVVYYANYLRYLERGRADYLRERGASIRELHDKGYLFPVVRLEIDYLSSAVYDDLLRVETAVAEIGNASFTLGQKVVHAVNGKILADSIVTLACVGPGKKVRRLPKDLLQALRATGSQQEEETSKLVRRESHNT